MSDADLVNWLRGCVSRLINGDTVDGDIEVEKLNATADRIEALAAEVERLGKCYDRAIASRLEWRRQAESANRALAEAIKVIGFYADEGNWRSPSKGFALQYDPEPSAFQKDRGGAARDFITAQEKEKGK
jgi:hypothetical protein